MTLSVTHSFVSAVSDSTNTSVVRPTDWNATHAMTGALPPENGGTGVVNSTLSTITISGAYAITYTLSGITGVTLPTSGTLAALNNANTWTAAQTFSEAVVASSNLTVSASLTANSLTVSSNATIGASLTTNTLTVSSNAVFSGSITVSSGITGSKSITASSNITCGNLLTIGGDITNTKTGGGILSETHVSTGGAVQVTYSGLGGASYFFLDTSTGITNPYLFIQNNHITVGTTRVGQSYIRPLTSAGATAGYFFTLNHELVNVRIASSVVASSAFVLESTGNARMNQLYGNSSEYLIRNSATLNSGSSGQVATITNGPTAGNPTKWIPVDDNGTLRYVPAW